MKLESAALTHQGYVRKSNQDAILALSEHGVFVVADGMGGEKAGDEASAQVISTIQSAARRLKQNPPTAPDEMVKALRETLTQANRDVLDCAEREPAKTGMGSTASMLCLRSGAYFTAHVGDSRIYLVRGGVIRLLTRDHTIVWMLYEQGRLQRDQMELHPSRHMLTQCIGAPVPIEIDTAQGALRPGDIFLICSDGLTRYADEQMIRKILLKADSGVAGCAEALMQVALRGGAADNISVVLVRVIALDLADNWLDTPSSMELMDEQDAGGMDDTIKILAPAAIENKEMSLPATAPNGQAKVPAKGRGLHPDGIPLHAAAASVSALALVLLLAYLFGLRFF